MRAAGITGVRHKKIKGSDGRCPRLSSIWCQQRTCTAPCSIISKRGRTVGDLLDSAPAEGVDVGVKLAPAQGALEISTKGLVASQLNDSMDDDQP